jgi:hypothetical protein
LAVDTRLAGSASPYLAGDQEAEDAEMVHAVAPGAAIRVILLPASNGSPQAITNEYVTALGLAPSLGGVVSTSAGLGERCGRERVRGCAVGLAPGQAADAEHELVDAEWFG